MENNKGDVVKGKGRGFLLTVGQLDMATWEGLPSADREVTGPRLGLSGALRWETQRCPCCCYSHFAYLSLYNLLLHVISTTMLPQIIPGGIPREAETTLSAFCAGAWSHLRNSRGSSPSYQECNPQHLEKVPFFWTCLQFPILRISEKGPVHPLSCSCGGWQSPSTPESLDLPPFSLHHCMVLCVLNDTAPSQPSHPAWSSTLCFPRQKVNLFSFINFTLSQGPCRAWLTPELCAYMCYSRAGSRQQVRGYRIDNKQTSQSTNWKLNDWQTTSPYEKLCYSNTIVLWAKSMSIPDL